MKPTVIHITGYGRSGSTLVNMLLNGHSAILGCGGISSYRSKDMRKRFRPSARLEKMCSCGNEVSSCPFWREVFGPMEEKIEHGLLLGRKKHDHFLNRKHYYFHDGKPADPDSYLKLIEEVYHRIVAVSGKRILVDSSKDPSRIDLLARSSRIKLVVLHLVRDVRGCVASIHKRDKSIFYALFGWIYHNIATEIVKRRNPDTQTLFLHYTRLCNNPRGELTRLLSQIGLAFEEPMLRFRSHELHDFSGNKHKQFKDRPEVIEEDLTWEQYLGRQEIFVSTLLAGWLNDHYIKTAT